MEWLFIFYPNQCGLFLIIYCGIFHDQIEFIKETRCSLLNGLMTILKNSPTPSLHPSLFFYLIFSFPHTISLPNLLPRPLLSFPFLSLGPPTIALDASMGAEDVLSAALEACEVPYRASFNSSTLLSSPDRCTFFLNFFFFFCFCPTLHAALFYSHLFRITSLSFVLCLSLLSWSVVYLIILYTVLLHYISLLCSVSII